MAVDLHGVARHARAMPGVRLSETVHAPGEQLGLHVHASASLCLVLRGGFRERVAARAAECAPAMLVVRGPGVEHSDTFGTERSHCFNLELDGVPTSGSAVELDGGARAWAAARLLRELRAGADDAVIEPLALELGALCFVPTPPVSVAAARDAVRSVTAELRACLAEPPALAALAERVGVHPMHLTRLFRRAHGTSIGEYVRALRVELACRRLAASRQSVADIAAEAGFTDQAHLTRVFGRMTGLTPARYRALLAA